MTPDLKRLVKAAENLLPVLSPLGYVYYHMAVKELRDALAAVAQEMSKTFPSAEFYRVEAEANMRDLSAARDAIRLAREMMFGSRPVTLVERDEWRALPAVQAARGEK